MADCTKEEATGVSDAQVDNHNHEENKGEVCGQSTNSQSNAKDLRGQAQQVDPHLLREERVRNI